MPTPDFYPWQIRAFQRFVPLLERTHGAYVGHDVGMGKTLTCLTLAGLMKAERVVVFTTSAGLGVWDNQIKQWFPADRAKFRIYTYDALSTMTKAERESGTKLTTGQRLIAELMKWIRWANPGMIICDEGHRAKSPSSKQSRGVRRIAKNATYRLWASGTPKHDDLDWWAQMQAIAPHEPMFQTNYSEYRQRLAVFSGPEQNWIKQFRDGTNGTEDVVSQVRAVVEKYIDYAPNSLLKLPEPRWQPVTCVLGETERRLYDKMVEDYYFQHEGHDVDATIVLTQYLRLQQITSGFAVDTKGAEVAIGKSKLDVLKDLLDEWAGKKVVISCRFQPELKAIEKLVHNRNSYVIDGSVADKAHVAGFFQASEGPAVMLIQQRAGGTAIDLSAADAMIFPSFELSRIAFEQVIGRAHRPGQTSHLALIPILAADTKDGTIYESLKAAKDDQDLTKLLAGGMAA